MLGIRGVNFNTTGHILKVIKSIHGLVIMFAGYFASAVIIVYLCLKPLGLNSLFFSQDTWNSMGVCVILLLLQEIARGIGPHTTSLRVDRQKALYTQLADDVKARPGGEAVFYHYSGANACSFIEDLYRRGYKIRLYIQKPSTARTMGSAHQEERISASLNAIKHQWPLLPRGGRLEVYATEVPISLRGVKIDNDAIIMGFYVWQQIPGDDQSNSMRIEGHDTIGVYFQNKDPGFDAADDALKRNELRLAAQLIWSFP